MPTSLAAKRAERIEKLRSTMRLKRSLGQVTGRLPLGFRIAQVDGVSVAVEDSEAMRLLAEAKEMHVRGVSIRKIRSYLTERGFCGRSGKAISVSGLWKVLQPLKG